MEVFLIHQAPSCLLRSCVCRTSKSSKNDYQSDQSREKNKNQSQHKGVIKNKKSLRGNEDSSIASTRRTQPIRDCKTNAKKSLTITESQSNESDASNFS